MIVAFGFSRGIRVSAVRTFMVLAGRCGAWGALATRIYPVSMSDSRKEAPGIAGGGGIPALRFTMTPAEASSLPPTGVPAAADASEGPTTQHAPAAAIVRLSTRARWACRIEVMCRHHQSESESSRLREGEVRCFGRLYRLRRGRYRSWNPPGGGGFIVGQAILFGGTGNVDRPFADLSELTAALLAGIGCALAAWAASGRLREPGAGLRARPCLGRWASQYGRGTSWSCM